MKYIICLFLVFSVYGKEETLKFPFSSEGRFELVNGAGDVGIVKGSNTEIVVAYKMKDRSGDCEIKKETKGKEFLKILAKGRNCRVVFAISLPEKTDINIKTGSGALSGKDLLGKVLFKTGSGNMQLLGDAASFEGKTGSGDLKFVGKTESLSFRSGSGDLDFEGYAKSLNVKTGSGDLKLLMNKLSDNMFTLEANSGSGDVEVFLPNGTTVNDINFKSGWGKMRNQFAQSDDSKINISVRTGSGNLNIKRI